MEGKVENLRQIVNQRLVILNARLAPYDVQMYDVPLEPSADHIRRMVADLDWVMESVEPDAGRDSSVSNKYTDVRKRLTQMHELLREEPTPQA